ncbi:hypothetical protein GH714_011167 [Hevea brasiliensis]|uniref:Uncharacterized protein n=1 Tax=Hevea brasiliensis TaxID=3981 RepID=A0A6A6KCL4_HEVBR|nr:hypothetical protein GH714_011058 [Hevea brasiliensis]KAF2286164.1 hypothetical protein GH714_011167 [Hevea brasiliensis]
MEDPPSKPVGQFLHKRKATGEFCLDMDLEMAELQKDEVVVHRNLTPVSESPTTVNCVSFDTNPHGSSESVTRRHRNKDSPSKKSAESANADGGDGKILKCSSRNDGKFSNSSSIMRKSHLLKERSKSRLKDPLPQPSEKSGRLVGRSGQLKSGFIGKGSAIDDEEDDPLLKEDLPEEYKKDKFDIWILLEWESLFNQYVIETLSGPPLTEIQRNEEEEERIAAEIHKLQNCGATVPASLKATACPSPQGAKVRGSSSIQKSPITVTPRLSRAFSKKANEEDDGITIDQLRKLNPKNVSAWNMKRLMKIIRYGTLSTLDEQIRDTSHDDDESSED